MGTRRRRRRGGVIIAAPNPTPPSPTPLLDFSDADNSMYIPIFL